MKNLSITAETIKRTKRDLKFMNIVNESESDLNNFY